MAVLWSIDRRWRPRRTRSLVWWVTVANVTYRLLGMDHARVIFPRLPRTRSGAVDFPEAGAILITR
jgi:hypothetical protein